MPFTPSHAVVALPFVRTRLVPAAIAVGAMTPDLPLFVRGMWPGYGLTHDFAWLPVTVAVAFVLLLIWRCVLRPATRELLPRPVAQRLPVEWDTGARAALRESIGGGLPGILWLVVSLALGVASHIAWDLFTHEGRVGEQLLPALAGAVGPFTGAKWLQTRLERSRCGRAGDLRPRVVVAAAARARAARDPGCRPLGVVGLAPCRADRRLARGHRGAGAVRRGLHPHAPDLRRPDEGRRGLGGALTLALALFVQSRQARAVTRETASR